MDKRRSSIAGWLTTCVVWVSGTLLVIGSVASAQDQCVGDCNGDCNVSISELIRGVGISLGQQVLSTCAAFDNNRNGSVAINELIGGVRNALDGCGDECSSGSPSPSPTPTPMETGTPATSTPDAPTGTPDASSTGTPATAPTATHTVVLPTPEGGLIVSGASAGDSTTVRVSFNGIVEGGSALNPNNYSLLQTVHQQAAGPRVIEVRFARLCNNPDPQARSVCNETWQTVLTDGAGVCTSGQSCSIEDRTQVVLVTHAHAEANYLLRVSGVRDSAGNVIRTDPPPFGTTPRNERTYLAKKPDTLFHCPKETARRTRQLQMEAELQGKAARCEPVLCAPGGAPCPGDEACVTSALDCDGDGLTDEVEATGWQLPPRVFNCQSPNQPATHVTSLPTDFDSDNDGLWDGEERGSFGFVSNPGQRDTDGEGLDDYFEVVLWRIDPNSNDTDCDGADDAEEMSSNFNSAPNNANSDGDFYALDSRDFGNDGGDPRFASVPSFRIRVGDPTVRLDYVFEFTNSSGTTTSDITSKDVTLSQSSSSEDKETDTGIKEWYAKLSAVAKAKADFPDGFTASIEVTGEAGYGTSGKNEVVSTKAKEMVDKWNQSQASGRTLQQGEMEERKVKGAMVSADVTFESTGQLPISLSDTLVAIRVANSTAPGELVTIGQMEYAQTISLSARNGDNPMQMVNLTWETAEAGLGPSAVDDLLQRPRDIVFAITRSNLRYPAEVDGKPGPLYSDSQQAILDSCGRVTIDSGGASDRKRFFLSSNLGRWENFRDSNFNGHEGEVADRERVLYAHPDPESESPENHTKPVDYAYMFPRLTEALDNAGVDFNVAVDPVTNATRFTSIDGLDENLAERRSWIVVVNDVNVPGKGGPEMDGYNPGRSVDEVEIKPGAQIWIAYIEDFDGDGVPKGVEDLYGSSDNDPDGDTDGDGLTDFQEIYSIVDNPVPPNPTRGWNVSISDHNGERREFRSRSNPALADSDFDLLSDSRELELGTAADRADTDGDGVLDGAEVATGTNPLASCGSQRLRVEFHAEQDVSGTFGGGLYFPVTIGSAQTNPACTVRIRHGGWQAGDLKGVPPDSVVDALVHANAGISVSSFTGFTSCIIVREFSGQAIDCGSCGYSGGGIPVARSNGLCTHPGQNFDHMHCLDVFGDRSLGSAKAQVAVQCEG